MRKLKLQSLVTIALILPTIMSICADPNCKTCTANVNMCESCKNGYYLNTTDNSCGLCDPAIASCSACSYVNNAVVCKSCSNRHALNTTSPYCVDCQPINPLCNKCSIDLANASNILCTECDSTSVMKEGVCNLCGSILKNCQLCSDNVDLP